MKDKRSLVKAVLEQAGSAYRRLPLHEREGCWNSAEQSHIAHKPSGAAVDPESWPQAVPVLLSRGEDADDEIVLHAEIRPPEWRGDCLQILALVGSWISDRPAELVLAAFRKTSEEVGLMSIPCSLRGGIVTVSLSRSAVERCPFDIEHSLPVRFEIKEPAIDESGTASREKLVFGDLTATLTERTDGEWAVELRSSSESYRDAVVALSYHLGSPDSAQLRFVLLRYDSRLNAHVGFLFLGRLARRPTLNKPTLTIKPDIGTEPQRWTS